ncbi:type I-E CRISPR-associated protein Cse2/CasB [Peptoniphilus sp. BV3AC2]|uniref:type I-E CRISPR-associated protein Cse2/CasB n=1 Tax=Peptoniphilus sp. BV3AC2 TaxID=1111133 RepID=UPI0003B87996|nr:type I-E CRISPR-associated protein Cse2/CasB [Peptoniphilus sp. BV3AC2]ERT63128.1 CRISPR type TIGR02548-associated protein CasB/Cse2 [Peptoniphilus sp. BV3AC2]
MQNPSKRQLVYSTTNKIIFSLEESKELSKTKATLSNLRNSVGRPSAENLEGIKLLYQFIPEEFYTKYSKLTYEENAILTTLQLYAIHQQSEVYSVNNTEKKDGWDNVGESIAEIRTEDNFLSLDRRFNAMITSQSFEELSNHLRQLIKILKGSKDIVKINYPKLSKDLYDFARGYDERVRLNWSRAYYSKNISKGEENE